MMRRIAGLAFGLMLVAGAVQAQAPGCKQFTVSRVVSGDSVAFTVNGKCRMAHDTVTRVRVDTVRLRDTVFVHDSVPVPPKDTTPTPPPPPADTTPSSGTALLFDGTWTTLPTDGQTAGAWRRWGGQGSLALVDATGLGFPAKLTKVLRVVMGTGDFDWVETSGKWTLPAVGESRAYRVYFRNAQTATGSNWAATHPVESKGTDGSISGNFYAWHIGSGGQWAFSPDGAGFPRNHFTVNPTASDLGTLPKNTTLRVEWKWTRQASGYALDLRIYDQSGALLYDKQTIRAWGNSNPTLASNNTGFAVDDAAMTGIRFGINGGAGAGYVYWGGFAVCADWCGAY